MLEPLRFIEAAPGAPIACSLDAGDLRERGAAFGALRERWGLRREAIEGGARLWYRPEAREDLERLIQAESECCEFFDFRLERDGEALRLEVRAPEEAASFVEALFGEDETVEASERA